MIYKLLFLVLLAILLFIPVRKSFEIMWHNLHCKITSTSNSFGQSRVIIELRPGIFA